MNKKQKKQKKNEKNEKPYNVIQEDGYYLIEWTGDVKDKRKIIDFLSSMDLPDEMSFVLDGSLYVFGTSRERLQFALGFWKCWDIIGE